MNDYKVGRIADLISDSKGIKIKSKKKKKKAKEEKSVSESFQTNKRMSKKQKNENAALEKGIQKSDPVKSLNGESLEKIRNKKKRKNSKIDVLESENKPKKRKKEEEEVDESEKSFDEKDFESRDENTKMGIDLNFVPSDSDKDENETEEKPDGLKPRNINKKTEYEDFTECTVFIGNLPLNYDKQKVSKMFSKYGKIKSARIRCVPIADINMSKKVAAIKKKFNSKRNSLVAYVRYETQASADAALEANGMVVDGHHLRVDLAKQSKENDNKKAVFVGGLPFDIEDDELWAFFQNCGKINSVRVIRDSQTSMGKGFGYVNFDSTATVELALQMNGQELKKRTINVKRCVKARNKNKLNAFGRKKSKELTDQLLCKRGKKFKEEKKKKEKKPQLPEDFQGRKASMKEKKKKKLSKAALRQRKLAKVLGGSKS